MTTKKKIEGKEIPIVTVKLEKVRGLKIAEEPIDNAEKAKLLFQEMIGRKDREVFAVACVDTKGKLTNYSEVHVGSLDSALIHPREVFKTAILANAGSIIAGHNHPSGDLTPSFSDIKVTKVLIEAGKILDIKLVDHIIVTEDDGVSIRAMRPELFND